MGVIADFIIATESEALEYSRTQSGISSSNILELKGITCVELSTLAALLDGKEWQDDLLDLFPAVGGESSGLSRVADQLLGRLAEFDYDPDELAAEWSGTEEMQCGTKEARILIDELAQFAAKARSIGKPIYLWNCV